MSRWWVIGGCLVAMLIVGQAFYQLASWTSRGGQTAPLYSSYRHDPHGTAALFDLLEMRGLPVDRITRPRLSADHHGTLVQVLPSRRSDTAGPTSVVYGSSQLIDWMHDGNTVIQFTRQYSRLMEEVGVPKENASIETAAAKDLEVLQRQGADPDDLSAMYPLVTAASEVDADRHWGLLLPQALGSEPAPRWRPLAKDGPRIVAAEMGVGAGRLVIIGAPTPASNSGLLRGDNVELLLELLGDGPVLFDEWSLGVGQHHTMLELISRAGLTPVLLQAILALGIYHWSTRRQRSEPDPPITQARSSVEQIHTLGYLYRQSLSPDEVSRRVVAEVYARLAGALRCKPSAIAQRAKRLPETHAAAVQQLLTDLEQLAGEQKPRRNEAYAAMLDRSYSLVKALEK
ncbi:MAG: DUF4350 domain-containing protein [Phycisphaeraceae bacterium]